MGSVNCKQGGIYRNFRVILKKESHELIVNGKGSSAQGLARRERLG